ncbi:hypothetical protein AB0J80_33320 [Actinoplanes sp. NPDC049548]|uniref:hypothetical protein n=1 Tax=Actinoplanes sp. NPDC049548 TaxID=3155152 RepID=UPI00343F3126
MRAKRLLAGVLAGATALTVIGGCAARQIEALEPKLELRNAAQQLTGAQQAGVTLAVTGDPEDLISALELLPKADFDAEDSSIVRKLFDSSLTIAYDKAGAGPEDDRSMIAATVNGVTGTEIRYLDGTLYAKVPVAELAAEFGTATSAEALSDAAAGKLPDLEPLFEGKWVAIESKKLTHLAGAGFGLPTQDLKSEAMVEQLTTAATNLLDGASVVRDSADPHHLIVTSSTAQAYAEAKRFAVTVEKDLAGELPDAPADRPIVLDLWIDGGRLTAAEIDILQFIDGATGHVAIRLDLTTGTPITAPDGAAKIDVDNFLGADPADLFGNESTGLLDPDTIAIPSETD